MHILGIKIQCRVFICYIAALVQCCPLDQYVLAVTFFWSYFLRCNEMDQVQLCYAASYISTTRNKHLFQRNKLSPTSALKMEAVCFFETLISTCKSIRRYYPEDQLRHIRNVDCKLLRSDIDSVKKLCMENSMTCPDDGNSKHPWNVGKLLPDYTAQQPRRQPSSYSPP
jgi:hypothetical protein